MSRPEYFAEVESRLVYPGQILCASLLKVLSESRLESRVTLGRDRRERRLRRDDLIEPWAIRLYTTMELVAIKPSPTSIVLQ